MWTRALGTSVVVLVAVGCSKTGAQAGAGAPPPAVVVPDVDLSLLTVEHPEQFPLATAVARVTPSELVVTGAVMADVTRNVPVTSLASGRVVAIHARVGDTVKKGQVLLSVRSDDASTGISDFRKAVADEALAHTQLDRAKDLYDHGAISMNDLQLAENVETKAQLDVASKRQHLKLLGETTERVDGIVDLVAPIAGVITDQQVTNAAGVQALGASPFTISDLSQVWVVCDVYENDLAKVAVGDRAEIRLNAYPDRPLQGTVSNIGAVLDPNLRTAKVRIEVKNPGLMRLGMFVTATLRGQAQETHTVVPAGAVLHLHDRTWVFVPAPGGRFRRQEVVTARGLPDQMLEIASGIGPGQPLVSDALVLDHAAEL